MPHPCRILRQLSLIVSLATFALLPAHADLFEISGVVGGSTNPNINVGTAVSGMLKTDGTCTFCALAGAFPFPLSPPPGVEEGGLLSFLLFVGPIGILGDNYPGSPLIFDRTDLTISGASENLLEGFLDLRGNRFSLFPEMNLGAGVIGGGFSIVPTPEPTAFALLLPVFLATSWKFRSLHRRRLRI